MKILMVCLGNICRSPMAQGIMQAKLDKLKLYDWKVDSAGTSGWHDGQRPDPRAMSTTLSKGIDISDQFSRKIVTDDLIAYDCILAMDKSNYHDILRLCKDESQKAKVHLLMNFKYPNKNIDVPDPYYDGSFGRVFDLLDDAIDDVIEKLVASQHYTE